MTLKTPEQPQNSFRVILELEKPQDRLDQVLMNALKNQDDNLKLKTISKTQLKKMFIEKRVLIKSQSAKAKSSLNSGTTFVDIILTDLD